jgi:serine/threonine-protein kinase
MSPAPDPSRDLLFGLIALQVGLVDQAQLVSAFQAWTLDKAQSLADHLMRLGHLDADDRAAVETMVARHLKRYGGDAERSLAALGIGDSTRERLASLADPDLEATISHVGHGDTGEAADRAATDRVGATTSAGQRFRVLRPHARGGLGAVFVALDSELNREVALKQILDQHADNDLSRQRFLVEAEITGGLEHPGIVPVYGLGTYTGGRPYYAMRFIRGDSLRDAIAKYHGGTPNAVAFRQLLRRFLDVCNAMEYAHARGVLHRDLKPSNIIVGKYGETLVVDWGLAKATGRPEPGSEERALMPPSAGGPAETLPGGAIGTPAYMSPEQACGDVDAFGPRSDVYSLGPRCTACSRASGHSRGTTSARSCGRSRRGSSRRRAGSTRRSTRPWRRSS